MITTINVDVKLMDELNEFLLVLLLDPIIKRNSKVSKKIYKLMMRIRVILGLEQIN